jgi:tetratricopeptide (TPR) repeat protein
MDNADDPSLELPRFLPRCGHGHVIITTRNHLRKVLAPKSTHPIESLPLEESTTLLLDASEYEGNEENRVLARDIAQELGCLPLAVAHAGAFILVRQCLDTYLDTYRSSQAQLLERKFELSQDYPHSVATTIEMSLEKLSPQVIDLIRLFSHLGTTLIPRSIFDKAASTQFRHVAKGTSLPLSTESLEYAGALMSIVCPKGNWNSFEFDNIVEECEKYSLLRLSTRGREKFYSMHILVQNFIQSTCSILHGHPPRRLVVRLLGSTINSGSRYEHIAFHQLILPLIQNIGLDDVIESGDSYGFAFALEEVGQWRLAADHMEQCVERWRAALGEEEEITLDAMEGLAHLYSMLGRKDEALDLRKQVVERRQKLHGRHHIDTLKAINGMAISYSDLGREEALPLLQEVLETRRKLLGEDHLQTLCAMNNLASIYSDLGRDEEALLLREVVLEKRRKQLGEYNLETVRAMGKLANSYSKLSREKEALLLEEDVSHRLKGLLGEDHPHTLTAMNNLANTYLRLNKYDEAFPLEKKVLEKRRNVLGEDYPQTLKTMGDLTRIYAGLGQDEESERLEKIVQGVLGV